ncbi:amyloid beta A4 precursor protein-binding family B member 1-interacting protein isoform X2 [Nymphalis io]|uniref:amyloid beta A4 precursor protein-binding family B member 1-interacting protein isoform X2 n=1 Tax=Inachis io TaxID=171585 RepID=UPI0021682D29|nr:amyloid beta A4 precursor protein-binding family B member 1-interacting protein isoform X2 [Nymphalis io]XP_050361422.1 amyloid beta A4 precursor protein-binding family B member 1-interacting protein isoform X2 [Nymphalis io]XP_050361423.1 amyloid beta A4 precursor protein-binding family B member 1-interacting protein isoform X2 [Nymphalis io]
MALVEDTGAGAAADDPEALLNEWLGELTVLTAGLNASSETPITLRPLEIVAPRIDTYRFSMANLEETQDADLDAILGELCALDSEYDEEISRVSSDYSSQAKDRSAGESSQRQENKDVSDGASTIARTDSPDNDSAFSDTVSMLSSESSASSSASSKCKPIKLSLLPNQKDAVFQQKADKIKLALERMREANVKKLFIKAFSMDGSSKSLLIDEKMTCGYVARLLADKNHVSMEPKWAIVEHLPDLHMERVYEDHEMLVDNLMLWTRESKNKILFAERPDKISLFQTPERFLLTEDDKGWCSEQDEHSRQVIIEEFFGQSGPSSNIPSVSGHPVPPMEGPLYLKSDAKKGWKKFYFVLRPSGLYYLPKDKVKTLKELVCLATFDTNEVYLGLNWKKKYKSPTDYCFAIKHPRLQQPKSVKFIKFLCADDQKTLERWITAMRIAKHGRQLLENHRSLVEELTQEDLDHLAHARSCSITSIPTKTNGTMPMGVNSPAQSASSNISVANSDISSGRHSRASSSSSSGCLSDGGTASESAFDCEFPMGTIKRKPSMKPNIPLTWMTRQLKEMVENEGDTDTGDTGTLTRRTRPRDDSTLKRHHSTATESSDTPIYSTGSVASSSPVRHQPPSPSYGHYETITRDPYRSSVETTSSLYGYTIYDKTQQQQDITAVEDLPLPPPPTDDVPDGMFSSTLSLDSLPPPPPPLDSIEDINGSQLSLPPPPPEHAMEAQPGRVQDIVSQLTAQQIEQAARAGQRNSNRLSDSSRSFPRQPSLDSVHSEASKTSSLHSDKSIYGTQNVAYGACLVELQSKKLSNGSPSVQKKTMDSTTKERTSSIKKVNFADDLPTSSEKKTKKITFNLTDAPPSPRKPPPPKRNESTRLSSPKKLADSNSNPPKEFLKDLQRVMRKKWQVAQKCKLEPATTPHEVLGFREYPLSDDYKETSVSMWVQEHYGGGSGIEDPFYENVFGREAPPRREEPKPIKKRPPPAPPRRSDSTHLTTHPGLPTATHSSLPAHPSTVQPTA